MSEQLLAYISLKNHIDKLIVTLGPAATWEIIAQIVERMVTDDKVSARLHIDQ